MKKIDDLRLEELEKSLVEMGEPKFKARQIFDWVHNKTVDDFEGMTNISRKTKEALGEIFEFTNAAIKLRLESKLDETKKYVIMFEDGNVAESVFLKYKFGNTGRLQNGMCFLRINQKRLHKRSDIG